MSSQKTPKQALTIVDSSAFFVNNVKHIGVQ